MVFNSNFFTYLIIHFVGLFLFSMRESKATNQDRIPGARYPSVRGMALGDSMIGFGETAQEGLFYNPALLAKNRSFSLEFFNFQSQMNPDLMNSFSRNIIKFPSLSQYASTLEGNPRAFPEGSVSLFPNIQWDSFAIGMLYQTRIASQYSGGNIRYKSLYQFIPTAGFGVRLASGVLKLGYSIQYVNQASGDETVLRTASTLGYNQSIAQGAGFSHLLGMQLTLPYVYQPTFNLVARNIGGLKLSGSPKFSMAKNATGSLSNEDMSLDFGVNYRFHCSRVIDLIHSVTYRDFTDSSSTARLAHFASGLELQFNQFFFFRAGFASAYPSLGFGFQKEKNKIDFSWSSEEIGSGLRSNRNRRVSLQISVNAF